MNSDQSIQPGKKTTDDSGGRLIGTFRGTVTNLNNNEVFNFDSTNVFRKTTPEGRLQAFALMRHPDSLSDLRVEFQLDNKDAPTDEYTFPSGGVHSFLLDFPFSPAFRFAGEAGTVQLQNHAPGEVRINGVIDFRTENRFGDQFDVRVNFEATGER